MPLQATFSLSPFVPISHTNIGISFASHEYWIDSMKFVEGNHYHQQMNWLHFGWNCKRDNGTEYDRISELTLNWCCHTSSAEASYYRLWSPVSFNNICNYTNTTEYPNWHWTDAAAYRVRRHHITVCGLQLALTINRWCLRNETVTQADIHTYTPIN